MLSLYLNPDLDDCIFYFLLTSMAVVQAEDVRASFLFVDDLNGHHQEGLTSTTTSHQDVAVFDFTTVSGCDQLVVGPTHACGGTPTQVTLCRRSFRGLRLLKTGVLVGKFSLNLRQLEYSLRCNIGSALP